MILGAYLAYFDRFVPAVGATLLKNELDLSDAGYGLIVGTLFALAYAITSTIIGSIGRERWRFVILACGLVLWTGGTLALCFVRNAAGFAAAQILVGAGQAAFIPAAVATLARASSLGRLGSATARFTMAATLGRSSAVLVAGTLITVIASLGLFGHLGLAAPWRATFLITAIPNLIVFAAILVTIRTGAKELVPPDIAPVPNPTRVIAGLFITASAAIVLIQSVAMWFPTMLVRLEGIDAGRAAVLTGAVTLVSTPLGQWLGGRLTDRIAWLRRSPTRAALCGLGVAAPMLSLLMASPPRILTLAILAVANIALGIASLAVLAGLQRAISPDDRARANGYFFAMITMIGLGSGPLLVGLISDASGDAATGLAPALAVVAILSLAVAGIGHLLARHGSASSLLQEHVR